MIPYKQWKPPALTSTELGAVADSIDASGINLLVHRFIRLPTRAVFASGLTWMDVFDYWLPGLICIAFGFIGAGLGMYGDSNRIEFLEGIGGILCAVGIAGTPVFLGSIIIVAVRYRRWLSELAALRRG
jgi:hypothetical protein